MRPNPFESQLERLARTLTDHFGVQVICQGDNAYTDGRRIVLPALPEPMDPPLERMIVGFLDHEMSHVAFSDFKVVGKFNKKHPGYEGLLNAVEDALIEKRAMRRWPGVRANLDAMFDQVRHRVTTKLQQADAFHRFSCAVYLRLSHHGDMLGFENEVSGFEDLLDQFVQVRSTQDAAGLSERILDRWLAQQQQSQNQQTKHDPQQQPNAEDPHDGNNQQAKPGDDDKSPNSQSNTSSGASESKTDSCEPQPGGSTCPPPEGTESPETSADGSKGAPTKAENGESEPRGEAPDTPGKEPVTESGKSQNPQTGGDGAGGTNGNVIGEVLREAIEEYALRHPGDRHYRTYTTQFDHIDIVPTADKRSVTDLLARGADTIRRLRRGLINALRSAEKRWWREDQNRGALSPRTLHRLSIDHARLNVFRTRSVVQGRSTAVSIVLDASGSMTARKMEVARDAVRVLLEALAQLNVATEAITFTTGIRFDVHGAAQSTGIDVVELRSRFNRIANLEIGLIKQFSESVKLALRRLPSIRGTGLTPLGEAMEIAARRLLPRPENRKILLVLTDGKAGCEGSSSVACAHAQSMAHRIAAAGIELIGVGVKDDSVTKVIEDSIVVYEIQDLPVQLCKLLGRTLKKGLRHVG